MNRVVSIIDDDASVRVALGSLVRSLGYTVHTFDCAESFLDSPDVRSSACIVTDIQMPGMSGLDLLDWLRAAGIMIPIVLMTAFAADHLRHRAEMNGAVGFLAKPFEGDVLAKILLGVIGA